MDSTPDRPVALLPIHPEYVGLIASGDKRAEFRRTLFAKKPTHVILYATSPENRLVGYFSVAGIDHESPRRLWDLHRGSSGLSRERFFKYLHGKDQAMAIRIGEFRPFRAALRLADVGVDVPPQGFRYLDGAVLTTLEHYV